MDAKESQLLDFYHSRIVKNLFDEKDVYMFLILLRDHAGKKSPVYEFGNFVAHREKDRGYIHEYVRDKKHIFDRFGKIDASIVIKPVFSHDEIRKSFNDILKSLGKQELSNEIIKDITLCIIILLQDVRLVDKKSKQIGKLAVGISEGEVSLLGQISIIHGGSPVSILFPALSVPNDYSVQFKQTDITILEVVTEAVRVIGKLGIKYLTENKIDKSQGEKLLS